jgi:mono/diheme cytochrome c family protein
VNRVRAVLTVAWLALAGVGCGAKHSTAMPATSSSLEVASTAKIWLPPTPPPPPSIHFAADIGPLLARYCQNCHNADTARGDIRLDNPGLAWIDNYAPVLAKVAAVLQSGDMPPAGKPRPRAEEIETLNAWLDTALAAGELAAPGSRPRSLRRLNRAEYNNTIRDLLDIDLRLADDFPADDSGYGFDNNGDVLSLPPVLAEKYLAAAGKAIEAAFRSNEIRRRILNPSPDIVVPFQFRAFVRPDGHDGVKRGSSEDLPPPPAPQALELRRAADILRAFADRAYRRPVTHAEIVRLQHFVEEGQRGDGGWLEGLQMALRAVLVSPHFLFRVEADPRPGLPPPGEYITDFELASRLSYFLWSSMPDAELFAQAARGTLRRGDNLRAQVERMLRDDKAIALTENFAGQWLQTRALAEFRPDPSRFPEFDESLRRALVRETALYFDYVAREDRSVLEFIDSDYSFLNERLARHYGVTGVDGERFRRVSVAGTHRGGLLTQASVLAVTSNPTRTSPVKRGKWILDNFLGTPPAPPPTGVEGLRDDKTSRLDGTLRQRLERHRSSPACAACHRRMDPLGFGLENFDPVGGWRDSENGQVIDASGTLPDGHGFVGPVELKAILLTKREQFARCLAEKLHTYALGRGTERSDHRAVDAIAKELILNDYRFSALVMAVVRSYSFQTYAAPGRRP